MDPHRLAELTSLAFHRAIAERLAREPALLARARDRARAAATAETRSGYARAWAMALDGPLDALVALLVADDERSRALRQSTPFAGALEPRERWRIWREARASLAAADDA